MEVRWGGLALHRCPPVIARDVAQDDFWKAGTNATFPGAKHVNAVAKLVKVASFAPLPALPVRGLWSNGPRFQVSCGTYGRSAFQARFSLVRNNRRPGL